MFPPDFSWTQMRYPNSYSNQLSHSLYILSRFLLRISSYERQSGPWGLQWVMIEKTLHNPQIILTFLRLRHCSLTQSLRKFLDPRRCHLWGLDIFWRTGPLRTPGQFPRHFSVRSSLQETYNYSICKPRGLIWNTLTKRCLFRAFDISILCLRRCFPYYSLLSVNRFFSWITASALFVLPLASVNFSFLKPTDFEQPDYPAIKYGSRAWQILNGFS